MKLEAQGICRDYFRNGRDTNLFRAVHETDFSLEDGSLTEITGRSGSGKTTFTNMLAGLLVPSEGTVMLGDDDLYSMDDDSRSVIRNKSIGIIPQGQTGLQSLTVLENVLAPAWMYAGSNFDQAAAEEKARSLLEAVGIEDLGEVYSNELSGGELRRMSIARSMINDPDIIIADEPTADLDDETTAIVLGMLKDYTRSGHSVLMVTHEKEAADYADHIYRMDAGRLTEIR